ncbi:hypothetical protein F4777DRAFT_541377 [Nemania sp. FL0916]|nr:hypothetical protein F4777DRAFT_541377 [Nemania sp. FL0916]
MVRKRACDVCYRRKIQCYFPNPESPCEWCNEHDLSCTFDRESQKKKAKRLKLSDVEGLFSRVAQLESALAESRANQLSLDPDLDSGPLEAQGPASLSSDSEDDVLPSGFSPDLNIRPGAAQSTESPLSSVPTDAQPIYFSLSQNRATNVPLAQYWYSRGISLLSDKGHRYMRAKTSQDSIIEKLRVISCQSTLQPLALPLCYSNSALWELPPKKNVEDVASVLFKSPFQRGFPILDSLLFKFTIEDAYTFTTGMPSPSQAESIACIFAVLSLFCRLEPSKGSLSGGDGDVYAAKAHCVLRYTMTVDTSVVSLQTIILLQRYHMFTARAESAALLHAIACRMVCALGGHTYQLTKYAGPGFTWAERQAHHLRTLFWLCYMSDKDISLRSGQPPLLTEEYCDLTIPDICTSYCAQSRELQGTITSNEYHFHVPGDPSLCRLKENIHRLLFSPSALKLSDGELIFRIRQLDADLESWRLSIPHEIRPSLTIIPTQMTPMQEPYVVLDPRYAHLQLEYHHLVTAIHTTIRRCGADNPEHRDLPDDLHSVIHSSCDLSLEASGSTIMFLESPAAALEEYEFSDIIFYVTLAVVSLFIDVLAHPSNAHSHTALGYLSSAVNIIRSLSTPASTPGELKRIQEMERFITELIRLGNCAIAETEMSIS